MGDADMLQKKLIRLIWIALPVGTFPLEPPNKTTTAAALSNSKLFCTHFLQEFVLKRYFVTTRRSF